MISVVIFINDQPIVARSAHRTDVKTSRPGVCMYLSDDGRKIYHAYDDGAVALAIKMLSNVVEGPKQEEIITRNIAPKKVKS